MSLSTKIDYFPPRQREREPIGAPVDEVTLLEDRAQVRRRARINLEPGQHRLLIDQVSPVIQDVSVRAEVIQGKARVADIGARRAMRVKREHKSEEVRALDARIEDTSEAWRVNKTEEDAARGRLEKLGGMIGMGAAEIPQDAAWGDANPDVWRDTFDTLFARTHALREQIIELQHARADLKRTLDNLVAQRHQMSSPAQEFAAWIELDLVVEAEGTLELVIDYTTPNAMWRPMHTARQEGEVLHFTCCAALWQNTGEDWEDVTLLFSTARSSLGTEPPLLHDDFLRAARKSEQLVVEARNVSVQSASVKGTGGGGGAPAQRVDLPGVDDGGEVQNLKAESRATVRSDGAPNVIPLFEFQALCELTRVLTGELDEKVFLKCTQTNMSPSPILAGPVELLREGGTVGWTSLLYVAPNEKFELGFGPQDDVRVAREQHVLQDEVDPADSWRHRTTQVNLYLSNLSDESQTLDIIERVPISEIEKVKVFIIKNQTSSNYEVDDDGFVTWRLTLAPHEHRALHLCWRLSMAPDVQGL